tara:strand:+ start:3365 stop:4873 length:1509 start_codon:yes stop_codon:yes gene_type:complete
LKPTRLVCLLSGFACALSLHGQEAIERGPMLTLADAIDEALVNNLSLRIDRYDPLIAEDDVVIESASFDPVLNADISLGQSEDDDFLTTNDSRSYSAGVSKRLALTNATLSARTNLRRNDGSSYNEDFDQVVGGQLIATSGITVGVTQPLLRDFGAKVATADLNKARASQRIARLQLRDGTLELLESVELAYWSLAEANARRLLTDTNRELAERLLEETREREELGLLTALDVIQAEANLAQRIEDILVAQQSVDESKDRLLRLLGRMDYALALSVDIDVAELPLITNETPELASVWRDAMGSDYTSLRQQEVVTQREIDRIVARNARKPELDLSLSATVGGRSEQDAEDAYDRLLDDEREAWSVEFSFNYPLGQRAARAGWRNADRRLDQAELQLLEIRQDLLQEVRSAWRELDTRKQRLRAAELVLRLQEQTFEQERVKLDEGLSTLRDVLEIRTDLDDAQLSLLSARSAAIQAEVSLERIRGSLLERHGLSWNAALSQP